MPTTRLRAEKPPEKPAVALREALVWPFSKSGCDVQTVRMQQTLSINTTPAVLAATLAGGGLSVLPDFLVSNRIATGELAQVLAAWSLPSGGIHVVYPPSRFRPTKVTAFVKMLISAYRSGNIDRG